MALSTEASYKHWVARYCDWLRSVRSLPETPAARMEGFLTALAHTDVAASTQNQAFNAVLFLYRRVLHIEPGEVNALRAKLPSYLRHAPSTVEVAAILAAVEDTPQYPYRLIVSMLYGCGLRVSEPLELRLRDLDLAERRIIVRQAKGRKDRLVPVPACLVEPLGRQVAASRLAWQRAGETPETAVPVKLPHQLARKYPSAGRQLPWWWLFPAAAPCDDPRSGERVWWHCLPAGVQKAMRRAARRAGIEGSMTPHHLRHAWATHSMDQGASVRDLQEILGHKSLETTMLYVHPEIERVPSPLDALASPPIEGAA